MKQERPAMFAIFSPLLQTRSLKHRRTAPVTMEFHVSGQARKKYEFEETFFSITGNVILANFHAARVFAQKMNQKRDLLQFPEQAVRPGDINAMGLIDEILHYIIDLYRQEVNPNILQDSLSILESQIGEEAVERLLRRFVQEFPPRAVYSGETDAETYLNGKTSGIPNRHIILEELIVLWLGNINPAYSPYLELFDDIHLEDETAYLSAIDQIHKYFDEQPLFGPDNESLIKMLRRPALEAPHFLSAQLEFIRKRWGVILGKFLFRLLSGLDLIREEEKLRFGPIWGGLGPGAIPVPEYGPLEEAERFSPDKDWMPRIVLLAKSALVWLDQLSKKYGRHIHRLDQIPDEELDMLARWGFTGLWLIGLWERSKASKKIKHLCGNPDAESSAYALFDYIIADELGGYPAYENLRDRCWQRGIRLASDMVPNHTGIDGKWVIEHPDWFIQTGYSPFPSYSFNGPNLSENSRVGVYLEDHYYNRSDAAVVFKRVDFETGDTRYIYHGNDGTSMPWNDTAQLNYLNPEVREAVIQTILHVARMFSVIRFDAAMVLTKRHFQRLWFPEPGTAGDIPSRAEFAMTKHQFNEAMPEEFWREVVDRIAAEVPDTLLLAEAFWMLEGYFVRTLGMHRVYNSAFMNMLKNEENDRYRQLMKNTLEFNPEILKRYVNFMNNPDEDTAVAQFGKGDKYIGVCLMMVTMPGLPMFGHGQIEGFTEKYGMEFRRAYWEEEPDPDLIYRHEREIFPLMKKRYLFSEVGNFYLYDVFAPEGYVNENVFAYSNRRGEERALVVYNNQFQGARGWISRSVAKVEETPDGRQMVQKSLGEGLALQNNENRFCIFRDQLTGLEFIRNNREIFDKGLYVELTGYQSNVFLDFREVEDDEWHQYSELNQYLGGRGVPSIDEVVREIFLRPVHQAFRILLNQPTFEQLLTMRLKKPQEKLKKEALDELEMKTIELLREIKNFYQFEENESEIAREIRRKLETILQLEVFDKKPEISDSPEFVWAIKYMKKGLQDQRYVWITLFNWAVLSPIGKLDGEDGYELRSRSWVDEWLLPKQLRPVFRDLDLSGEDIERVFALLKIAILHQNWFNFGDGDTEPEYRTLMKLIREQEFSQFLQVNRYQDVLWFNKEAFEVLVWWLFTIFFIKTMSVLPEKADKKAQDLIGRETETRSQIIKKWLKAGETSGYQLEKLLDGLREGKKSGSEKRRTHTNKIKKGRE